MNQNRFNKKTIFFDACGTLFDVREGVGVQYSRIAAFHGVLQDPAWIEERFCKAFQKSPPLAFPGVDSQKLKEVERRWWRHLVQEIFYGIPFPKFDLFFEELYMFFEGTNDQTPWTCFPETLEVLEHLRQEGYPLGIISNFDSRLSSVLEGLGIARFFQTLTVSSIEGVAKPSVEIFKRALAKGNCTPKNALYIGDTPEHDGIGAIEAEILFLLIDRASSKKTEALPPDTPIIKNLREIALYAEDT